MGNTSNTKLSQDIASGNDGSHGMGKCAEVLLKAHIENNNTLLYQTIEKHPDDEIGKALDELKLQTQDINEVNFTSLLSNVLLEVQSSNRNILSSKLLDKHLDLFIDKILYLDHVSVSLLPGIFSKAKEKLDEYKLDVLSAIYLRTALDQGAAGNELGLVMLREMAGMDISTMEIRGPDKGMKAIHFWAKMMLTSEAPTPREVEHQKKLLSILIGLNSDINEKALISYGGNDTPVYTTALGWACRVLDQKREGHARIGIQLLIEAGAEWRDSFDAEKQSGQFMLTIPHVASQQKMEQLVDTLPEDIKIKMEGYKPGKPKI